MKSRDQLIYNNIDKILDNINEGIHVVNEVGKTIIYNKKMSELESMDKDIVLGKKITDVFPSLNENNSTLMLTLKNKKEIKNNQQEYLNKYGQKIITINSTIPIFLENGSVWALEIARDITETKKLYNKIVSLQEKLYTDDNLDDEQNRYFTFNDIKGDNKKLKQVISYARQAARTDSSILIVGDTGTGKELFAQGIHSGSRRQNKPFIAQNCAALPENLLEGILFGTRKGGFTGAINRKGLFEQANGGTLLLDEINSMSKALQAKLLRVLQEGLVRPVGGKDDIKVDVRIIATSNKSPVESIREGNLREDLYYRLAVVLLQLPLLSERQDDILLLANYFIDRINKKFNKRIMGLSDEVKEIFYNYSWPGNVRQLEHVIEGAINIISDGNYIKKEHVKPFLIDIRSNQKEQKIDDKKTLPEKMEKLEKEYIIEALKKNAKNITATAKYLGIKRQSLQYRMNKYDINLDDL
ncbi:MAG: sigma 54-interacting transcriptional regulator [Halanaerobiales bacterium]|nr:sigma 54-interacting transcriptional regulator [Halanaerobiales bacterium]